MASSRSSLARGVLAALTLLLLSPITARAEEPSLPQIEDLYLAVIAVSPITLSDVSPDGRRLVCLSSPRLGPHFDVFDLMLVDLTSGGAAPRLLLDAHQPSSGAVLSPTNPLPDTCWRDDHHVAFNAYRGVASENRILDVDSAAVEEEKALASARSPLLPKNSPHLPARLHAEDQILRWKSFDEREIEGVLTVPPASVARPPYKLLVLPHGGPHSRIASGAGFDTQIFATRGYAVFQPNIRGSLGYGVSFLDADRQDFGGGDMRDLLMGIDSLVAQGIADPQRQFVYGVSYGGYMTTWLVGHTKQFRAAVAQNAVTDLNAMWHLSDLQSWTEYEMGGLPWQVPERMREQSPLSYASQVRTPTLMLNSLNDRRCPIAMGKMFYRALQKNGVESQMVIYPDEGHGIKQPMHREDVMRRVLAWFDEHGGGEVSKAGQKVER